MLRLFDQIQIETRYECNLRCPMCPNVYMDKAPFWGQEMSYDLFNKIIANLKKLNFKERVTLYLSNEPLLDERLLCLIAIVKQELPECRINTSTNGTLLTPDLLRNLFEAGLSDLDISCYTKEDWEKWLPYRSEKVHPYKLIWGEPNEWFYNRGGNIEYGNKDEIGKGICRRPFHQLYVCSSGECVICCSDFKREVIMGDLNFETIEEVWDNAKYQDYRSKMLHEQRMEIPLCNTCNYSGM